MELVRLILILTGVALLVVAYLMGRKNKRKSVSRSVTPAAYDPSLDDLPTPVHDPLYGDSSVESTGNTAEWQMDDVDAQLNSEVYDDAVDEQLNLSYAEAGVESRAGSGVETTHTTGSISDEFEDIDLALDVDPDDRNSGRITSFASAVEAADAQGIINANAQEEVDSAMAYNQSLAEEFEVYNEPVQLNEFSEKLVSINIVAASGRRFYGNDLKALFDKHGYNHGRMSLYHCLLDGDKVFSVANMVKPGTFDEAQMRTFETPGITLFMRLPIELDSDVAFDFLIREAKELADELDGQLRDENRNPLSEQTIQHMREDIQQYVFRNKRVLQSAT